jgi:hypothetical protein
MWELQMTKATSSYDDLLALRPSTKSHPLEDVVRKIFAGEFEKYGNTDLDLTQIAAGLGASSHPKQGRLAYRTVAEDVLGYMTGQGKLVRDDSTAQRLAEKEKP